MNTYPQYMRASTAAWLQAEGDFVHRCHLGTGRTVMSILGMRARAMLEDRYRALVVVPSSVHSQWIDEIRAHWPEIRVVDLHGASEHSLETLAGSCVIVASAYDCARDAHELRRLGLDDMVVDSDHAHGGPIQTLEKLGIKAVRPTVGRTVLIVSHGEDEYPSIPMEEDSYRLHETLITRLGSKAA